MKHLPPVFFFMLLGQFGFDFGDGFDGIIGGITDAILQAVLAALAFIWNVLVAVANYIWSVLQFIWQFILRAFNFVKNGLKWLWENVVKQVITKLLQAYTKLRTILAPIFNHLLLWLQKARYYLDLIFNRFVKPYLVMIQKVRQVLGIFRLLGFKWAQRLDARLGALEAKIIGVFQTLRVPLNQAISFLQLLADPLGILRRNPLIAAVLRDAPEIKNAIDTATMHPQTTAEINASHRDRTWFDKSAVAGNQGYFAKRQLPPDMEAARQEFIKANTNPLEADSE